MWECMLPSHVDEFDVRRARERHEMGDCCCVALTVLLLLSIRVFEFTLERAYLRLSVDEYSS